MGRLGDVAVEAWCCSAASMHCRDSSPCSTTAISSRAGPTSCCSSVASAWGVVLLCWGALQVACGLGLIAGSGWARWAAVVVVFVDVILQLGFLPAYPIWGAILILLDVLVIFALTARWAEARAAM